MNLIERVLDDDELRLKPPVFLDIGASGAPPSKWRAVAKRSICIALDADTREFTLTREHSTVWSQLIRVNRILVPEEAEVANFYLTKSPFCSSTLRPDLASLDSFLFREAFTIVDEVTLPCSTPKEILAASQITYIDWYKSDSQGTDLRLLRALPSEIRERLLVVEVEPGLVDAYLGEDKFSSTLSYMEGQPFHLMGLEVKSTHFTSQRIAGRFRRSLWRLLPFVLPECPGWVEATFVRQIASVTQLGRRESLLTWVFASILGQHAYASLVADRATDEFRDDLFAECATYSANQVRIGPRDVAALLKSGLASRLNN